MLLAESRIDGTHNGLSGGTHRLRFPRGIVARSLLFPIRHAGGHRRVGESRHDRVHVDAVRRVLPGRSSRERRDARLGGRVGDAAQVAAAMFRGDGRHVDDAPVMLLAHAFDGLLDGQEVRGQIDREDAVPPFQVGVVERVLDDDPRNVDEDVDAAESFVELPEEVFHHSRIGDVADGCEGFSAGVRNQFDGVLGTFRHAVVDRHLHAFGREQLRHGLADALSGSSDQRALSVPTPAVPLLVESCDLHNALPYDAAGAFADSAIKCRHRKKTKRANELFSKRKTWNAQRCRFPAFERGKTKQPVRLTVFPIASLQHHPPTRNLYKPVLSCT